MLLIKKSNDLLLYFFQYNKNIILAKINLHSSVLLEKSKNFFIFITLIIYKTNMLENNMGQTHSPEQSKLKTELNEEEQAQTEKPKEELTPEELKEKMEKEQEELPEQEQMSEEEIERIAEERTNERAMQESYSHFKQESEKLPNFFQGKKDEITDLLDRTKQGEEMSPEEIKKTLNLEKVETGHLELIASCLNECKPIESPDTSFDVFKKLMQEKMNPDVKMKEAEESYDAGESWYHTTEAGKSRLSSIREQEIIKAKKEFEKKPKEEAI